MNEGLTSNSSFIEATRGNTLVAEDIRAKAQRKREKQADPDAPDEKQKAASFDDVYDGEWFVDAEDDEELQDTMLAKHGFRTFLPSIALFLLASPVSNIVTLFSVTLSNRSAPNRCSPAVPRMFLDPLQPLPTVRICFFLRLDCQLLTLSSMLTFLRHEVYQDQYRALIVTDKVRVSKKNTQRFQDETGAWFEHWTAYCRSCDVEVGNYDPLEQMYHFYSVLPSR